MCLEINLRYWAMEEVEVEGSSSTEDEELWTEDEDLSDEEEAFTLYLCDRCLLMKPFVNGGVCLDCGTNCPGCGEAVPLWLLEAKDGLCTNCDMDRYTEGRRAAALAE